LNEFNTTDKWFAGQFSSAREGVNLSKAECLVAINIDFSAVTYFQFRDRMSTIDRKENNVFFIFSKNGIENKIYKTVLNKSDYTLSCFTKDFNIKKDLKNNKNKRYFL
jgi:hypothetical protein